MKRLTKICFLIGLTLLLVISCGKDTVPTESKNPVIKEELERLGKVVPTSKNTLNLEGVITNEAGVPLSGVVVKAGNKEITTDAVGFFQFIEVSLNESYAVVKANKSGYFEGIRTFASTAGAFNKITIALLSKGTAKSVNAETGGMLEFESGKIKLDFPANALIDDNGDFYKGTAQIRARYIDPEADNFGEVMPGMLVGLTEGGSLSGMISYGMIWVEITDGAGKKLEISVNLEVGVEMPTILDAPSEMPIWHFNETFGLWVEAGKATKVNDKYKFKANYFSSWNLDVPFNGMNVTIQFENQKGIPLPSQKICVYDSNDNLMKCVYSDNEGKIKLLLAPQNMVFKIITECGETVSKSFTASGATGKVVINTSAFTKGRLYKLTGKMEDCEEILSNKFFTLSGEDNIQFQGKTKEDGTFEVNALLCDVLQSTVYDLQVLVVIEGAKAKQYEITLNFSGSEKNKDFDFCKATETNPYLNPLLTYGNVTDIDGNKYATIQIGFQTWMAENLKTTKYNDGTPIFRVLIDEHWGNTTDGQYAIYDNNAANNTIYGKLYNWNAVNTGKLCPTGWHIPTDAEWTTLTNFLGGESVAGDKMKSTTGWARPNTDASNSSGFSGLPGGRRDGYGIFNYIGDYGYWWSSREANTDYAWYRYMNYSFSTVTREDFGKSVGFSCRCVRD